MPLPVNFALRIMGLDRIAAGERLLESVPAQVAEQIRAIVVAQPPLPGKPGRPPDSLTYSYSARRPFEVAYWKTIASLAEGKFLNKNNADCVLDEETKGMLPRHERQLDELGEML